MFCSKCGVKNPDDAKFCEKCGNPIESYVSVRTQNKPQNSNVISKNTNNEIEVQQHIYDLKRAKNRLMKKGLSYGALTLLFIGAGILCVFMDDLYSVYLFVLSLLPLGLCISFFIKAGKISSLIQDACFNLKNMEDSTLWRH